MSRWAPNAEAESIAIGIKYLKILYEQETNLEILVENGVDHGLDDLYYGDQLQGFETVPLQGELLRFPEALEFLVLGYVPCVLLHTC